MEENKNEISLEENKPWLAPHYPFSLEGHWQPWYDDRRDYNTNAPTYYDYLSNFNALIKAIVELLNRVARRNIKVEDTQCVDLTKIGDWIDEGGKCHSYSDVITLQAEVILSTYKKALNFDGTSYNIQNAIECLPSGLFAPNYLPLLEKLLAKINQEILDRIAGDEALDRKITEEKNNRIHADEALGKRIDDETEKRQRADSALGTRINNEITDRTNGDNALRERIVVLEGALTKILTDLKNSGAWNDNGNILSGSMTNNRHIATGNINLFGGISDGASFIRTTSTANENDVTIGVKG